MLKSRKNVSTVNREFQIKRMSDVVKIVLSNFGLVQQAGDLKFFY